MDKANELAQQMDVNFFDRKLQDEVFAFDKLLKDKKKDLTKGELCALLKAIVKFPDTKGVMMGTECKELYDLGCRAKETYMTLTMQILIEEGGRQSTPQFKPQGESDD